MKSFETPLGYTVVETVYGLDVYDKDTYLCELYGKTLSDYTYDGEVDGDLIDDDVYNELSLEERMN